MVAQLNADGFGTIAEQVLQVSRNEHTRSMYRKALKDFTEWWQSLGERRLDREVITGHLSFLRASKYSEATANQRLSAIKAAISMAADQGLLDLATARDIIKVRGYAKKLYKGGHLLSEEQAEELVNAPDESNIKGVRDRALLALIVGCALRSGEIVTIQVEDISRQKGHWALANVRGTRGASRTLLIPAWTKKAVLAWIESSRIESGPLLRAVDRSGLVTDRAISSHSVLPIVTEYGKQIGMNVKPRDLRRTCAQLCRTEGGGLEQIQLLLGHASIQTTEHYLGRKRVEAAAPNGRLRIKWHGQKIAS